MKILGFAIIRWKRLQQIHARNAELRSANETAQRQLQDVVERMQQDIDHWKGTAYRTAELVKKERLDYLNLVLDVANGKTTAPGTADNSAETKGDDYAKV